MNGTGGFCLQLRPPVRACPGDAVLLCYATGAAEGRLAGGEKEARKEGRRLGRRPSVKAPVNRQKRVTSLPRACRLKHLSAGAFLSTRAATCRPSRVDGLPSANRLSADLIRWPATLLCQRDSFFVASVQTPRKNPHCAGTSRLLLGRIHEAPAQMLCFCKRGRLSALSRIRRCVPPRLKAPLRVFDFLAGRIAIIHLHGP